jgi:hypothetical protein
VRFFKFIFKMRATGLGVGACLQAMVTFWIAR